MPQPDTTPTHRQLNLERIFLLFFILFAFGRLTFQLDAKSLWIDEGYTIERISSSWFDLLVGKIVLTDGLTQIPTYDQHPFTYFAFVGAFIRMAGNSEFALRFMSVIAATLMVPTCWAFATGFTRQQILPKTTPLWVALFVALHPFYLWYGQEARMYALMVLLAMASTYFLWRWATVEQEQEGDRPQRSQRGMLAAYVITLILLLGTHYYAILLLPIHALLCYQSVARYNRKAAIIVGGTILSIGLLVGLIAIWIIFGQDKGGSSFLSISLRFLLPDLLKSFGLGLSIPVDQVQWLIWLFGLMALCGAYQILCAKERFYRGGWLLLALMTVPIAMLLIVNLIQPAYLNIRHISLISGAYILLFSAGTAWLWVHNRYLGSLVAVVMVVGMLYSTNLYYNAPEYQKGEFAKLGQTLNEQFQPGDLILLNSPVSMSLYRYYLPLDIAEEGAVAGDNTGWMAVPRYGEEWTDTYAMLQEEFSAYQRIWLAITDDSGMVESTLQSDLFQIQERGFDSPISFLKLDLFLPQIPILEEQPSSIQSLSNILFGEQIQLVGYDIGKRLTASSALPITLYWQRLVDTEARYKYILQLVSETDDGTKIIYHTTEREPYDGALPMVHWPVGATIVEYSSVQLSTVDTPLPTECLRLSLSLYHAQTLEKLPITKAREADMAEDGQSAFLGGCLDITANAQQP